MTINRRILIPLLITLALSAGNFYYIHQSDLRTDVKVTFLSGTSAPGTWTLYVNDTPLDVHVAPAANGSKHQWITFRLPKKEVKNIRLCTGPVDALPNITAIKASSLFHSHLWKGPMLKKIMKPLPRTHPGAEQFLLLDKGICKSINDISGNKTAYYLAALMAAFFVFYFIYFFNARGLGVFFSLKILRNMCAVFLVIIFLPAADSVLNLSGKVKLHPLQEKRLLSEKPDFRFDSPGDFPDRYTRYFNDSFNFRNLLIHTNNTYKVKCFGVSPIPAVILGKEDWLFYAQEKENLNVVDYFRSVKPFSTEELDEWYRTLQYRRETLEAEGICYLFVISPDKSSIYPEMMPSRLNHVHKSSRLDQLIGYLREKDKDFPILDLRPALLAAKNERRVYRRTDSHWNDYGAYVAYREIIKYFTFYFNRLAPIPLSSFTIKNQKRMGGDLAILLYLQKKIFRGTRIRLIPKTGLKALPGKVEPISRHLAKYIKECPNPVQPGLPTAVMVHDSFAERLKPYLSEHFSRIVYIHDWDLNFFPEIVKQENAKIVIDEMAERFLLDKTPANRESTRMGETRIK